MDNINSKSYPPLEGGSKSSKPAEGESSIDNCLMPAQQEISGWGMSEQHKHKFSKQVQECARNLRNNATIHEKILWKYLRKSSLLSLKFRRQQPVGCYIVDFLCCEKKIIIELDGGQHNTQKNVEYDKKRDEFLQNKGYKVIRIWNNDITRNIEGVIEYIKKEINTPTPKSEISTLPQGEGKFNY